jgi:glutamate-1-semialdehyde 2,1-aminomutase
MSDIESSESAKVQEGSEDHLLSFDASAQFNSEARQFLAGGVSSNFRLGISPTPLAFKHAQGPFLYDVDGNRLIDYYLGMGPMLLGHTPSLLVERVTEQVKTGILFAGQSDVELQAARMLTRMVPCAERVRFASSGSEAVQGALRLARAATGRQIVIKFEGHYHGWFDNILWSTAPTAQAAGPRSAPNRVPGSRGMDPHAGKTLEILPWNDLALVRERVCRGDIAAVLMEPAMCNAGAISPAAGYLEGVKEACSAAGTLLIFDETITGFRLAPGGAQQRYDVVPDIATFAKAIANGFPVAAVTGRADVLDLFASADVVQGGTYNGQTLSMAATVATLESVSAPGFYDQLEDHGLKLMDGIRKILADAGVPATVDGFPSIFHVGFGLERPAREFRDLRSLNRQMYVAFTTAMLRRGVRALERGAWFTSSAHNQDTLEFTLDAVHAAAKEVTTN